MTPPVVAFSSPVDGSTISGFPAVFGTVSDAGGINRVELLLLSPAGYWTGSAWSAAALPLTTTVSGGTWSRTTGLPTGDALRNGRYILEVRAFDVAGNASHSIITVTVDKTAPTVRFTAPGNNAILSSLPAVQGQAADNPGGSGLTKVDLLIQRASDRRYWNGLAWVPASAVLSTTLSNGTWARRTGLPSGANLSSGGYYLVARAYDGVGLVTRAQITVLVDVTAPLSVTFSTPAANATLTRLTTVGGNALDNLGGSGIARVGLTIQRRTDSQFWNGTAWAAAAPELATVVRTLNARAVTWARASGLAAGINLLSGAYDLTAIAHDRTGNVTSGTISVTVSPTLGTAASTASNVALSTATASIAASSVTLRFGGALDAGSASDAAHYAVTVNGRAVNVESAAYDATAHSVTLGLPDGALQPGDQVVVTWSGLSDAQGREVSGHTGSVTAR